MGCRRSRRRDRTGLAARARPSNHRRRNPPRRRGTMSVRSRATRFFIPEVIQTSGMDCGPAALAALLAGFNAPVSYGRLREACHTDVDGTSIDTLDEIGRQL